VGSFDGLSRTQALALRSVPSSPKGKHSDAVLPELRTGKHSDAPWPAPFISKHIYASVPVQCTGQRTHGSMLHTSTCFPDWQADPNYKLLGRAYPYMARRLLTDPAPELRESFEEMIILVGGCVRPCFIGDDVMRL